MVRYRCVGWGTTNSSGVATLDYDADGNPLLTSGYTGQGVGEVDFVASAESPSEINSSSDVSQPYPVMDCIKYDKGNTANTIWTLGNNSNAQLDLVDNSYRKLSEITEGTDAWVFLKISNPCVLEFDVKITATNYSTSYIQLGQSQNATTRRELGLISTLQDNNWHHFKLEINGERYTYSSPETSTVVSASMNNYDPTLDLYFRFRTLSNVTEICFKEFEYYPL